MGTRQFKPITPATRFRSVSDFSEITKTEPERSLVEPLRGVAATSGSTAASTSGARSSASRDG